jgi:heme-degrading monooxygenase HmoA
MIARIWHGITARAKGDAYAGFLNARAIPDYRGTAGNLSVHILRRDEDDRTHFITLTFWESLETIKGFAGEPVDRAKYYPEDRDFLLEFEPKVQHWEVVGSAGKA